METPALAFVLREAIEALCAEESGAVAVVIGRLEGRIAELERRIGRDSSNSSLPASLDAPKSRGEPRRAAREAYKRSMGKSGGQPGHEGKRREMVAPERVDDRREHVPERCGCGHACDGSEQRLHDRSSISTTSCPCCGHWSSSTGGGGWAAQRAGARAWLGCLRRLGRDSGRA